MILNVSKATISNLVHWHLVKVGISSQYVPLFKLNQMYFLPVSSVKEFVSICFNCHILNVNSFRLILFPTILFDDGVVTIRVRSNTGTALSPRCTGARRIAGILDSHKVLPALQMLEGSLGFGDSPKIPSLFPWTVLHLQHHKRIKRYRKLYPWNSLPWLFLPQGNNFSQLRVAFRKLGLCRSSLILEDVILKTCCWALSMTSWPNMTCNQWQQIFLLGQWSSFALLRAWSTIFHILVGLFACFVGLLWKQRVSLFKIFDLQSASAASARFLTLPLSEIVPSSEILIECHIDLEASFKALLTLIPVDHLEWDEPLKNISCSGERSRLFQWESHSLCLSLFLNSSMQFWRMLFTFRVR